MTSFAWSFICSISKWSNCLPTLQSCLESISIYIVHHHLQLKVSKLRGIFHSKLFPHINFFMYISGTTITPRIPESNLKVHSNKLEWIHCLFLFFVVRCGWSFFSPTPGEKKGGGLKLALLPLHRHCHSIIFLQHNLQALIRRVLLDGNLKESAEVLLQESNKHLVRYKLE